MAWLNIRVCPAWTDGRTDGQTYGHTDWRTDGHTDGRTDEWTDGRTDGRRTNGRTDGRTFGLKGGARLRWSWDHMWIVFWFGASVQRWIWSLSSSWYTIRVHSLSVSIDIWNVLQMIRSDMRVVINLIQSRLNLSINFNIVLDYNCSVRRIWSTKTKRLQA